MLTQGIRRWLSNLFGWWPWKRSSEREYARVESRLNKSVAQEPMSWSTSDGVTPHPGAAPLIVGQGETSQTSLSTIDEWPERVVQSSSPSSMPPPVPEFEKVDLSQSPPLLPAPLPIDAAGSSIESIAGNAETVFDTPLTPERKLEFLHYLVRHGIVNEGFPEGQIPEQYKQ